MTNKKIFILLPDGVGLRNFAYSNFHDIGIEKEFDVIFWNNTMFSIEDLGFKEIKINNAKTHPLTDIYKIVKIQLTLNQFIKNSKDKIYESYKFPFSYRNLKASIKSCVVNSLILLNSSKKGLKRISNKITIEERKTLYYYQSKQTLEREKPSMVFCTNQRQILSVAPLLAAKDLNIPTATFIFSWDNLPKATMIVETDFYFVWSQYMKDELLLYYPYINENQIIITGTPQFEMHFDAKKKWSKIDFFDKYNLDIHKKYICFSGDDITSSPDDPLYLKDISNAIRILNTKNHNLGIIFRRCPVDFSNRYDEVLKEYSDIIAPIDPLWKPLTTQWNTILPLKEDDTLFSNIAEFSEMVVNLGSSTIFDFAAHNKPCGYFNYNQEFQLNNKWDIHKCYKFVHFRSMPNKNAVFWLENSNEIVQKIESLLDSSTSQSTIFEAKKWFETINQHPPEKASERIWNAIEVIIK